MQRKSSSSGDSPVAKGKRHAPPRFEPRRGMKLLLGLLGLAILTSALTFSSTLSALLDRPVPTFEVEQRESAPAPTSLRGEQEQEEKKEGEEENKRVEDKRHRAPTDECYVATDYGVLDGLAKSPKTYCSSAEAVAAAEANNKLLTSYTVYDFGRANLQATVFRKLRIDMNNAKVVRDISSIAEDGGQHDPRYWFTSVRPLCVCEKGVPAQDSDHKAPRVWNERFVNDIFWRTGEKPTDHEPTDKDKMHRVCERPTKDDKPTYSIGKQVQVLLVSRFNDHNPFFQISQTLNTWIMMKVLGWSNLDTQIVYIDKGLPAAVDELRHKMLAPLRPAMLVSDMMHQNSDPAAHMGIIELDTALVTPYEWTGPIMRHLDNYEPCARSKLIADFRSAAFQAMGVSEDKVNASSCIATIISRRDYGGRKLQRVWRNEQEVLDRMIADLGDRCTFQAVDFIELSFAEQMRTIVNSDIVIGMHGAGMGNVIWTRPGALVIEIFPKTRRRWGFRNICQEVGSEWHEFRGGEDVSKDKGEEHPDPNKLDKSIPPDEWAQFANPLLRAAIDRAKYGYR